MVSSTGVTSSRMNMTEEYLMLTKIHLQSTALCSTVGTLLQKYNKI